MNRVLISITARQLLGKKRTFVIAAVMALPILIAIVYRFASDRTADSASSAEVAVELVSQLILSLLLPLVALVLGTASLGAEIEDGTAVFLLTKPIERWRIIVIKTVVAAGATAALVTPTTMATAWIIHGSPTDDGLVLGLGLGAAAASVLYCTVFVALSAVTTRALVIGLIYVFVWEAIISNLFNALRWVSISAYATGWSDAFVTISDTDIYDPRLAFASAVVATIVVCAASLAVGTRALERFEIGERA